MDRASLDLYPLTCPVWVALPGDEAPAGSIGFRGTLARRPRQGGDPSGAASFTDGKLFLLRI